MLYFQPSKINHENGPFLSRKMWVPKFQLETSKYFLVTWRSGALEWAYSRKKVRHSTSPFVVGWTKKMEKRRKQKRPSGKQKEKWSRKYGNILPPRNCAQTRSDWSDAISDHLESTGIELGCRRILNFEKWFGNGWDLPRGYVIGIHNFLGNLFLEITQLASINSDRLDIDYGILMSLLMEPDCIAEKFIFSNLKIFLNFEKWFGNGWNSPLGYVIENHNFPGNLF